MLYYSGHKFRVNAVAIKTDRITKETVSVAVGAQGVGEREVDFSSYRRQSTQ